jgi:hypothetical protein
MTLVLETRPSRQHVTGQKHARPRVVECSMRHNEGMNDEGSATGLEVCEGDGRNAALRS